MKTDLKTPLKIHGSDDKDALYDAEGTYLAAVSSVQLLPMLEVVRRVNCHDALVLSLTRISNMNDLGNVREEAERALKKARPNEN